MRLKFFLGSFLAFSTICFFHIAPLFAQQQETFTAPRLMISIPGLDYSKTTILREGTYVYIPFLALYIQAFYKILIGIGLVATSVMMVYGGFLYMLSSTGLQVQDAKKKMIDGLIGLIILLGSYLILQNINPDALNLKGLKINTVAREEIALAIAESVTTQNITAPRISVANQQLDAPSTFQSEGSAPAPTSQSGGSAPTLTSCPFTDKVPGPADFINTRTLTPFFLAVMGQLKGSSFPERVLEASRLTVACGVNFGSCGQTTQRIWAMAGVEDNSWLTDPKIKDANVGWSFSKLRALRDVLSKPPPYISDKLLGLHCKNDCGKASSLKKYANRPDCISSKAGAVAAARRIGEAKASDYPDAYVDQLQAGDWIYFYSANQDCAGNHSVLFLEWTDKPGVARTLSGQVRTKDRPNESVRFKEYCLKKACGNYYPIVDIFRPKASALNFSSTP